MGGGNPVNEMGFLKGRTSERDKARIADLFNLIPDNLGSALDIGARDGYLSLLLANRFDSVTALDLEQPKIQNSSIHCVKGNVCSLDFEDNTFDLVLCAEVLEHIPSSLVPKACSELTRVSKKFIVIGVPYAQDIRVGRTTCYSCGQINPPWGHINVFDEAILKENFSNLCLWDQVSYVGENHSFTNPLSTLFMDLAGNPYGTYDQEEPCVACGNKLQPPPERTLLRKFATRAAFIINKVQSIFVSSHPNWIHVRFLKSG